MLARGIEEYDVGLTYRRADDIGALRGADDGVGNFGIRDQHILDVARQVDHEGFADAQRKKARIHRAIGGQRRRDPVVAREERRQGRIDRQRGDGRKRHGADHKCPQRRLNSSAFHIRGPFRHFCVTVELAMP